MTIDLSGFTDVGLAYSLSNIIRVGGGASLLFREARRYRDPFRKLYTFSPVALFELECNIIYYQISSVLCSSLANASCALWTLWLIYVN